MNKTTATVTSIWKWGNGVWAVYLPDEVTPGAYAQSKGFAVCHMGSG